MADHTKIEWTDATWNPITGCSVVSPGCTNCYAMKLAGGRLKHHPSRKGLTKPSKAGPVWTGEVRFNEEWLTQPMRWTKPRKIFPCAHGDLFAENVPDEWIDKVLAVMALCPRHQFTVLTKRADRMRWHLRKLTDDGPADRLADAAGIHFGDQGDVWVANYINGFSRPKGLQDDNPANGTQPRWPLPNVWMGVSVEDQERAAARIPDLLNTPAAVRFISAEPLLGPVKISRWLNIAWQCSSCRGYFSGRHEKTCPDCGALGGWCGSHAFNGRKRDPHPVIPPQTGRGLDWVIVGGESGHRHRDMDLQGARDLRDQCKTADVAFFMKQVAGKGEIPPDLMVREMPG